MYTICLFGNGTILFAKITSKFVYLSNEEGKKYEWTDQISIWLTVYINQHMHVTMIHYIAILRSQQHKEHLFGPIRSVISKQFLSHIPFVLLVVEFSIWNSACKCTHTHTYKSCIVNTRAIVAQIYFIVRMQLLGWFYAHFITGTVNFYTTRYGME